MYNATNGAAKWKSALDGLLNTTLSTFFSNDIMVEVACESAGSCTTDMKALKSFTARWLAATTQLAPYTSSLILPKLTASAQAAAAHCGDGSSCILKWTDSSLNGEDSGLGEEMSALAVVSALLVGQVGWEATVATGGVVPSNSTIGSNSTTSSGGSGNGGVSSSTVTGTGGAASTSATGKPSAAEKLSLDTVKLGMFSVVIGFVACVVL
jgi:mannan endo-1,6-alpha-mannosidase